MINRNNKIALLKTSRAIIYLKNRRLRKKELEQIKKQN